MTAVIVITGSSSGLGLATATAALETGARVVISSNVEAELETAYQSLDAKYPGQLAKHCCDVREAADVQGLLDAALAAFGELDAWINCAGTTAPSGPASMVPLAMGRLLIDVNILGSYHGSIAALRYFRAQGRGSLINIVGRGEKSLVAGAALYGASKAWVRQFTLALAKDEPDLQIGTFNPGMLYTALTARPKVLASQEEKMLKGLRFIMPLIGDTPERAGKRLAELALGKTRFKRENQSRRLLPFVLLRVLSGRRASVDVDAIRADVTPDDTGPIA